MRPDTLFKADCKSIKCRKRLLLSQVKCIFALKESFFDRGKRKQNIVIRSFLNRASKKQDAADICKLSVTNALPIYGERSLSKILSAVL